MKKFTLNKGIKRDLIIRIFLIFNIIILSGSIRIFSSEKTIIISNTEKVSNDFSFFEAIHRKEFTIITPNSYFNTISHLKKTKPKLDKRLFSTSIMGQGFSKKDDLSRFLIENNPHITPKNAEKIASLYIKEAQSEGVNYDVAFSQMCLETGFLKFGGNVKSGQNNFCGLGVTRKGEHGLTFPSLKLGIRAHIQHLKAYASTKKLHHKLVDTRFHFVKRGSVCKIDQLTGKWAHDPKYAFKIKSLLSRLIAVK